MYRATVVSFVVTSLALSMSLAADANQPDTFTLIGPKSFKTGYPATNPDGTINVVVEIPTGTTAKWEVEDDGRNRPRAA